MMTFPEWPGGRPILYVLNDKREAVPVRSPQEWAERWQQHRMTYEDFDAYARVGRDEFGDMELSTVFLGIDASMFGKRPLLFETMLFGPEDSAVLDRYSTWQEAEEGHKRYAAQLADMQERAAHATARALAGILERR